MINIFAKQIKRLTQVLDINIIEKKKPEENENNDHSRCKEGLHLEIPSQQYLDFRYRQVVDRIKNKIKNGKKINVLFLVIHSSIWQYDKLYQKYRKSRFYLPLIMIAPYIPYGTSEMQVVMENTFRYFDKKGYRAIKSYDEKRDCYLDPKKILEPDIVFFTNPHDITINHFQIYNYYKESLTCYVPYSMMCANLQPTQYNLPFHNLTWKNFYVSKVHHMMAKKYAQNKGRNTIITGYPKCDHFIDKNYKSHNVWKKTGKKLKRIIWAPHHTIEDDAQSSGYSNFLNYSQVMLDLANHYKNKVQIALKPHPILFSKLKHHPRWGEKKLNAYCKEWENGSNTQLMTDGYIDLFITSDAMIMSSISFITEYMYINKPALFLMRDRLTVRRFNEFGTLALPLLYKAYRHKDIHRFIKHIVIEGHDYKKKQREVFIKRYLVPPYGKNATDNIYNYINHIFNLDQWSINHAKL